MSVLGIDPGPAHLAWAILRERTMTARGEFTATEGAAWPRQRIIYRDHLRALIVCLRPELVSIEGTNPFAGCNRTPAQIAAQAIQTQRTEQLVGDVRTLCAELDVPYVEVTPTETRRALGLPLRKRVTDAQQARAAKLLWPDDGAGMPWKWTGKEHHMARAGGAALRGPAVWRLQQATKGQGRLAK